VHTPVLVHDINQGDKAVCLGDVGAGEDGHPRQGNRVVVLRTRAYVVDAQVNSHLRDTQQGYA